MPGSSVTVSKTICESPQAVQALRGGREQDQNTCRPSHSVDLWALVYVRHSYEPAIVVVVLPGIGKGYQRVVTGFGRAAMEKTDQTWVHKWIDAVADGLVTKSQRRLSSMERHGRTAAAIAAPRERGVHLAKLTDGHGNLLVAASLQLFELLC